MGGQEDMIVDVAIELVGRKQQQETALTRARERDLAWRFQNPTWDFPFSSAQVYVDVPFLPHTEHDGARMNVKGLGGDLPVAEP